MKTKNNIIRSFRTMFLAFLVLVMSLTVIAPAKMVQAHRGYPNRVKVTSKYKYDGKPHGLEIPDIDEKCIVKYGKKNGKYNLKKSPTRKKPGKTTVYFKVKDRYGKLLFTGKGKIVIKKPIISGTIITDQPDGNEDHLKIEDSQNVVLK